MSLRPEYFSRNILAWPIIVWLRPIYQISVARLCHYGGTSGPSMMHERLNFEYSRPPSGYMRFSIVQ